MTYSGLMSRLFFGAALTACSAAIFAAPTVSRLTPPSELFASGNRSPVISRFVAGQRFDLQATVRPDPGKKIVSVRFAVDGAPVDGAISMVNGDVPGLPANTAVATLRAFSMEHPGMHVLSVTATDSAGQSVTAQGNFEIVQWRPGGVAKNIIIMLGDGMGIAHRTAARIMMAGVAQGKAKGLMAMDTFPVTGLVMTHSLNSIVTDSAPGMSNYVNGNKAANNQEGVFPDDTRDPFDNPRVEYLSELLHRTTGKSLGIVTTADVFDATPAANAVHTANRGAGTGIVDQYLDDRRLTGLEVLMGGGRKWFLPETTAGSQRSNGTDYVLPADIVAGWGAAAGAKDPARDLIADFQRAGFAYSATSSDLHRVSASTDKLLGLFALSNMNVAKDKIDGRRGATTVVNDYLFPDQPMLEEMTAKALDVLKAKPSGFVLMVEGASIDKQAHNMDSERWILDTIEFDRAVAVAKRFAEEQGDTLVIVTADHECAGINIIGGSLVTNSDLVARSKSGAGVNPGGPRNGVVGIYDAAGFPRYEIAADGYPVTTDVDHRMLIGYAANADRYEDWVTNAKPLQDSQQPFVKSPPLSGYPKTPLNRDKDGGFLVTGQIEDSVAAHTASDIPLSAYGKGARSFTGVMDNTDVFFKILRAETRESSERGD
jgi:alkaline phosphatase